MVQVHSFPSSRLKHGEQSWPSGCVGLRAAPRRRDDGYALIDALVGLLIIALGLVFSLQAGRQARVAAAQAEEVRGAQNLLVELIEAGPRGPIDSAGATDSFSWRIETRPTGGERPIEICHRRVALTNIHTKRTYEAATLETCPVEAAG